VIRRPLGRSGLIVSALGLGCMGMSEFYGPTDEAESLRTLERALELGVDFLDTADMYGPYTNEALLGRFLKGRRDRVVLATKFGIVRTADPNARGVDNRPEHVRASIDGSLQRLGTDRVDLYYIHRVDRAVPIEETVGVLAELVAAGKVRAIGLSEVSAATLRRAHAVHPIAALQSEYSLFTRDPEIDGVLDACRELGVAFVAYSPLGRGMLTTAPPAPEYLDKDDFRRRLPRWQGEAAEANLRLADAVRNVAGRLGAIPGTKRASRVEENVAAVRLNLNEEAMSDLERAFAPAAVAGERSSPAGMALLGA
jgi:aryl-alcohol dehydrogenase-like predicted oxidoreductase